MNEVKLTIGRAIDQIVDALRAFEERDQKTILATVHSHLQLTLGNAIAPMATVTPPSSDISPRPPTEVRQSSEAHSKSNLDVRALKEQKKPDSARQMACLVAYYLQEHAPQEERKQVVSTADVEKYFKQAGFKLPEKMHQLLGDCKRSGYFESAERGEYKLTRVGYNLVTHGLPAKKQP